MIHFALSHLLTIGRRPWLLTMAADDERPCLASRTFLVTTPSKAVFKPRLALCSSTHDHAAFSANVFEAMYIKHSSGTPREQ